MNAENKRVVLAFVFAAPLTLGVLYGAAALGFPLGFMGALFVGMVLGGSSMGLLNWWDHR